MERRAGSLTRPLRVEGTTLKVVSLPYLIALKLYAGATGTRRTSSS